MTAVRGTEQAGPLGAVRFTAGLTSGAAAADALDVQELAQSQRHAAPQLVEVVTALAPQHLLDSVDRALADPAGTGRVEGRGQLNP